MITCRTIDEIRIKTPSGIINIPSGKIFNTSNINKVLSLLKSSKIAFISSDNDNLPTEQCPQSPQCLQSENCKGFSDADIGKQKSAMSASNQVNSPLYVLSESACGVREWDPEMQQYLEWFKTAPRIEQPFHLAKHLRICSPEKFYASLERSIQAGPSGPRGRHEAILEVLKKLKTLIDGDGSNASLGNFPF
jgi:hypothetical protein